MKGLGFAFGTLVLLAGVGRAQDMQISARAKGMGGGYTAFGDDPVAIWQNPAGTATQVSKFAVGYQSFVTYEFSDGVRALPGLPQATLTDPPIQPAFVGFVVSLSTEKLNHAFSFGFIHPIELQLTWYNTDLADPILTRQPMTRFRVGYSVDLRILDPGKAGFLPHVAVGGGIDWGSTTFSLEADGLTRTQDKESSFGGGAGILVTVFDDLKGFSVDFGLSFNSGLDFQFAVASGLSLPKLDWPSILSAGIAVYVGRLKVSLDAQQVDWESAADASAVGGFSSFEKTENFSVGLEYAAHLGDKVTALLRVGYRRFDAPWDKDETVTTLGPETQPVAVGASALSIETDGEVFNAGTVGAGIYWTDEQGRTRGFDFGVEIGGDKVTLSAQYVHDF